MGKKNMITPLEFANRVGRPYQTIMYWLRRGIVPGVEIVQETRGPIYHVPVSAVAKFKDKGPKRGRPAKAKAEQQADKKAKSK
jgi:hypothetical protein